MPLNLDVEYEDGSTERIPAYNREGIEFDQPVVSAEPVRLVMSSRDSLTERRYVGRYVNRAIRHLREGDIISVRVAPSSYSGPEEAVVEEAHGDYVLVDGFRIIRQYWANRGDGHPWLRTTEGDESRGMIEEIEVHELATEDS
jgi:hypothetical protein